jgi:hypothetical protein
MSKLTVYNILDDKFKQEWKNVTKRYNTNVPLYKIAEVLLKPLAGRELTDMDMAILKMLREALVRVDRMDKFIKICDIVCKGVDGGDRQ